MSDVFIFMFCCTIYHIYHNDARFNIHNNMYNSRKAACVSDSELFFVFVNGDGEGTARNTSEWYKII